jgi:hypothetical protein
MMRIYSWEKTFTPSGGAYSFNTQEFRAEIRVLQVKPTTSTTRYTITITNDDNIVVYKESHTGNLLDERIKSWYGIYTIAISAATVNEEFKVEIDYIDLQ